MQQTHRTATLPNGKRSKQGRSLLNPDGFTGAALLPELRNGTLCLLILAVCAEAAGRALARVAARGVARRGAGALHPPVSHGSEFPRFCGGRGEGTEKTRGRLRNSSLRHAAGYPTLGMHTRKCD